MQQPTPMSLHNRTGLQRSPINASEMLEVPEALLPKTYLDGASAAAMRSSYIAEAEAIGSIPVPVTAKGMLKSGVQMVAGNRPQLLMDKLGERLAFERASVRLYDAMLLKCETIERSAPDAAVGLPLDGLRGIRDEEAAHAELLVAAIEKLGGDPTAQTPGADIVGVQGMGLMQVMADPRTTPAQCLGTLLIAELADNAAWELLIDLAQQAGQKPLGEGFQGALVQEELHLARVKLWHAEAVAREARLTEAMALPDTRA